VFKKYTAFFTSLFLVITMLPLAITQKVSAYQNSSYFNYLKIGLVSMSAASISIALSGDYTFNGKVYPSGSTLSLTTDGTSILLNGTTLNQVNLVPSSNSNLLSITSGTVSNRYMGSFLIKVLNGKLLPINNIYIEDYLKGVVGYEMANNFPLEALKAQTIAARNYALSRIGYEASKGYDFDDTASYQVYKGYNSSYQNVINAVNQTRGEVLLYNDKLVETLYSAWHGGVSENSENVWGNTVPYLRSVSDPYESDAWPNGNRIYSNNEIQAALVSKRYLSSTDTFESLDLSSITRFASGRVSNINIIYKDSAGVEQTKSVTKDSTRTFLGLPSNLYTVSYDSVNGSYTFSGKGNGHGLGMSQIGAKNRASAGQTYSEILKFYYQGTYIQNLILKASLGTVTQNSSSLYLGNSISFNTSGTNGNGYGYLFKYVIKNDSNIVFTQDYSSSADFNYTLLNSGNYTAEIYIKDNFSISDYDDMKVIPFSIYNPLNLVSFNKNIQNVFTGDTVTLNSTVNGGSGSGVQYKYVVVKDGQTIASRNYDTNSSFSFVPSLSGNYEAYVYTVDPISKKEFDATGKIVFGVVQRASIAYATASGYFYEGKMVTLNATSTVSDSTDINYKYEIYNNGSLLTSNGFSKSSQFSFTPSNPGVYTIKVYEKDGLSSRTYDSIKQFDITISSKPLILSTLPLSYGMTSKDVTLLQNALIKLGYPLSGATGYFGSQTKDTVISFQKSKGLTADGIVGSLTYKTLNDVLIQKAGIKNLTF